jgi:tRNA-uridine 2-sulfurtransferase
MMHERVVVGMSGGVDSSAAVWMLHERGVRVTGVTLRFYCYARSSGSPRPCCSDAALRRARRLCAKLGIDHHVIDVEDAFRETVVRDFLDEYRSGRTPNPCVVCNEKVKFPGLIRVADRLGAERIATGHYARLVRSPRGAPLIAAARDARKDQSYFLYRVPAGILERTIFPLGDMLKTSVKLLAPRFEAAPGTERESQDVCFLPDGDLGAFLRERIGSFPGDVVDRDGRVLGRHDGAHLCTIGQRRGFRIAGGVPLYVSAIDVARNRVVLAPREALFHRGAVCGSLRLRTRDLSGPLGVRVRYARPIAEVSRVERREGLVAVTFREPQWAVTPGQSLVLYREGVVVGGGIIEKEL